MQPRTLWRLGESVPPAICSQCSSSSVMNVQPVCSHQHAATISAREDADTVVLAVLQRSYVSVTDSQTPDCYITVQFLQHTKLVHL